MSLPVPSVPWQVTGNHWVCAPCIHPADASIHAIGAVHAGFRGAVEFAGRARFIDGNATPLLRLVLEVDGTRVPLGAEGIAWERDCGWIPSFSTRAGDLMVRGTICAPHNKDADVSGLVVAVAIENRGGGAAQVRVGIEGVLGHRQLRIRTAHALGDAHAVTAGSGGSVVLCGRDRASPMAIAVAGQGDFDVGVMESNASWTMNRLETVPAGATHESWFHLAVADERDGAEAMLRTMLRRGGAALIEGTRSSLREMSPATGTAAADRLVARHAFFCYFGSVVRAIDQSHWYVVRSRLPWNEWGMTIRDWHALMWVLPAVQLLDQSLAREILLRICELHGYAPGSGIHYLDGAMFEPGFSLEGASSYAVAVDAYIVQSSDDKIVEEPVLADSLYGSQEDIEQRRHSQYPLYSTEVNPDGSTPEQVFTAHGNAVAALALDILRHTLDEKTAEKVQDPAAVRASLLRQFAVSEGGKTTLSTSTNLAGESSLIDQPSASIYWLPYFDLLPRDDSMYRRTVKRVESGKAEDLEVRIAQLVGPSGKTAFDWLRRAPLDGGFAAGRVDSDGRATFSGGGCCNVGPARAYVVVCGACAGIEGLICAYCRCIRARG